MEFFAEKIKIANQVIALEVYALINLIAQKNQRLLHRNAPAWSV